MSDENQHPPADFGDGLFAKLQAASTLDSLLDLLEEIERNTDALGLETSAGLTRRALVAVSRLTAEKSEVAEEVIVKHLLPLCLITDDQPDGSSKVARERDQSRKLLREWIYQYPQAQMVEVRQHVLADVLSRLERSPTRELIWVIAAIGFRNTEIMAWLWHAVESGDFVDPAISTLVNLGLPLDERDRMFDVVRGCLSTGEISHGSLVTVHQLVGPQRIELAMDLLRLAEEKYPTENHVNFAVAVDAATRAVDRCADPNNHEDTWAILRNHAKTVQMTSEYGSRCDTEATVKDHVAWLLGKGSTLEGDFGAYIMLSRLSELAKPRQLAGWDDVATDEVVEYLKRASTTDTGMEGRFTTTAFRVKVEAWETALTVGCLCLDQWVDKAVVDETSPYAVQEVAAVVSCLRVQHLPDGIRKAMVGTKKEDDDAGYLFRQTGLIEIARSSCTREAFESLLHFEFTHKGSVLLSTIDAIMDVAVWRLREGDDDVIDKLLEMTTDDKQKHHREAMITVFCRLCLLGKVPQEQLRHLWTFANAHDMDEYSRCKALEAIGVSDFAEADAWADSIREMAAIGQGELGWRACEALVRREWLTSSDEPMVFSLLGLTESPSGLQVRQASTMDYRQVFLIGLLFQKDQHRFGGAVCDILDHAPFHSVYQIVAFLRRLGDGCPDNVSSALVRRIHTSNNRATADTTFFGVLATVAPAKLLSLSREAEWVDWLVEARTALCEAIRTLANARNEYRIEAVACLIHFMRDASFQVRRSAYRAIAESDVHVLESVCLNWRELSEVELRKRAAEASAWLPALSYSDELLCELGFGWDPEPSVREVWRDVLLDRRRRGWAADYLQRIFAGACGDDQTLLKSYRYGRALTKIGDDESIKRIEEFVASHELRPNVKHWLKKTLREIGKQWEKVTETWREPWAHEKGRVEVSDGEIVLANGTHAKARLLLWCQYSSEPSGLSAWGGVAEDLESGLSFAFGEDEFTIQIPGRPAVSAQALKWKESSNSPATLRFAGNGPYPAEPRDAPIELADSLVDTVARIIRETGIDLDKEATEQASERLQPVLKRAEASLFMSDLQSDTDARKKLACQEAAFVTRTLGELLPRTFQSSVAIWRIANAVLEREALTLRMSPAELGRLDEMAKEEKAGASDDLLYWMLDHVEASQSHKAIRTRADS